METLNHLSEKILHRHSGSSEKCLRVYSFEAGGHALNVPNSSVGKIQLSTKGATLCKLCSMGLPVPPGFVLTTDNFREYLQNYEIEIVDQADKDEGTISDVAQSIPSELVDACQREIEDIERKTGRVFGGVVAGDPKAGKGHQPLPLLFSVRAGASVVVPGAMDAVLNVGITDAVVNGIIEMNQGYKKFALDSQGRFLHAYGTLVLRISNIKFHRILERARETYEMDGDGTLGVDGLVFVVSQFRRLVNAPSDPYLQLKNVIEALFEQSMVPRVSAEVMHNQRMSRKCSKELHDHPEKNGIALIVQQMVFGNLNGNSGSGACFSRHPAEVSASDAKSSASAGKLIIGEFLSKGEGGDVYGTRGSHSPKNDMLRFRAEHSALYDQLHGYLEKLEALGKCPQYVDFTVEDGVLYILDSNDVDLHGRKRDARFVTYYNLLLDVQREEEEMDERSGDEKSAPVEAEENN